MNDSPSTGLTLRIRPRNAMPGVASAPPMPRPVIDAVKVPSEVPAAMSQSSSNATPGQPPENTGGKDLAASEAAARAKPRLREETAFPAPSALPPVAKPMLAAPPPSRFDTQVLGPMAIEDQIRPEDSKLFRLGVKFFFLLGIAFVFFLGWLAWYFIQHREKPKGSEKPAQIATPTPAVEAAKKPSPTPTPKPTSNKPPVSIFEDFVAHLKISGVAQGAKPKALINGSLYLPGQVIEPGEGITIDRIDPERREIIFRSGKGELLKRRY